MKSYQVINSLNLIFGLASPFPSLTLLHRHLYVSDQCVLGVDLIPNNKHQKDGTCLKENGLRVKKPN